MEINYKEINETVREKGCAVCSLNVKYPVFSGNEKLSEFYAVCAEKYARFVKEKCFVDIIDSFKRYVDEGGRRSKYPFTNFGLLIKVTDTSENYLTVRTENTVLSGPYVSYYKMFCNVWNTENGRIVSISDLPTEKNKKKHDGFMIKNGDVFFYDTEKLDREQFELKKIRISGIPSLTKTVWIGNLRN